MDRFIDHVDEGVFPGGCFFVSAMGELGTHPGPVRDDAMAFSRRWLMLLAEQVAFEIHAYLVLGNMQFIAVSDRAALDRARRAVEDRLAALAVG